MRNIELIGLPYAENGLEPIISRLTVGIHHGKHLKTYVDNLNRLIVGSDMEGLPLEEILKRGEGAILNNAGQILNHNMYFTQFAAPSEDNCPDGELAKAIVKAFGSQEAFQEKFEKEGAALFGSGWVWLSRDGDGGLVITQEKNAANPVQRGLKPLLTFDVWEHAYYLDYQNRRAEYLHSLWPIVDWDVIAQRYGAL